MRPLSGLPPLAAECRQHDWPRLSKPVHSPANMQTFMEWANSPWTNTAEVVQVLLTVYIIDHRMAGPYIETKTNLLPGRGTIPVRLCRLPGCARCANKAGGWVFPWVDPRWTGKTCLDAVFFDFPSLTRRLLRDGPGERLELAYRSGQYPNIFDANDRPYEVVLSNNPTGPGWVRVWPTPPDWTPDQSTATPEQAIDCRLQMLDQTLQAASVDQTTIYGTLHGRSFGNPEVARRAAEATANAAKQPPRPPRPWTMASGGVADMETSEASSSAAGSGNAAADTSEIQYGRIYETIQQIAATLPLASVTGYSITGLPGMQPDDGGPPHVFHPAGLEAAGLPGLAAAFHPTGFEAALAAAIMIDSDSE